MLRKIFRNIRNTIDYPLRQMFRWSRGGLRLNNEEKHELFNDIPKQSYQTVSDREFELRRKYHFERFYALSSKKIYRINLYYLELMEKAFEQIDVAHSEKIHAADIGCAQWFYVQALYSFIKYWQCAEGRNILLDGFEVDAYRIYHNFYSRYDHAVVNIKGLDGVNYLPYGFRLTENRYHLITMFFPFVFIDDHQEWGLPDPLFHPKMLLADVWQSLTMNGRLLIVNQGIEEHLEQLRMIDACGYKVVRSIHFSSPFYQYRHSHHAILLEKTHE